MLLWVHHLVVVLDLVDPAQRREVGLVAADAAERVHLHAHVSHAVGVVGDWAAVEGSVELARGLEAVGGGHGLRGGVKRDQREGPERVKPVRDVLLLDRAEDRQGVGALVRVCRVLQALAERVLLPHRGVRGLARGRVAQAAHGAGVGGVGGDGCLAGLAHDGVVHVHQLGQVVALSPATHDVLVVQLVLRHGVAQVGGVAGDVAGGEPHALDGTIPVYALEHVRVEAPA